MLSANLILMIARLSQRDARTCMNKIWPVDTLGQNLKFRLLLFSSFGSSFSFLLLIRFSLRIGSLDLERIATFATQKSF